MPGRFREGKNMGLIITLIVGGIIGWLASIVMRTDAQQGIILNIIVGCVGSFLGRFLFGLFGVGGGRLRDNAFDPMTLLAAFVGAVVLLAIVNLFTRRSMRCISRRPRPKGEVNLEPQ